MHSLLLGVILAGGGSSPASALAITAASCTQQASNSLRFDCTITTDVAAHAWVKFGDAALSGGCDTIQTTPTATGGTAHTVTMYGMKASTSYEWKAYAAAGGATTNTACSTVTSGALPAVGATEANLTTFTVSTATPGTPKTNNLLTHWGCYQTGVGSKRDDLVVLDRSGNVVWYEEPAVDVGYTGGDMTLEAISMSRPDKHVLTIMNHEIVLEYDLSGNLLTVLCRDDGSGYCPGTTYTPDAFFDDYVHHDVQRVGTTIWALSAKSVDVTDTRDCDADVSTTMYPIIVDGLYGFDTSGSVVTQSEDWDWREVDTVNYTVATCAASTYWGTRLSGNDYMHTNSFWIDAADQWMFSRHNLSDIVSVDTTASPPVISWELDGSSGGDFTQTGGGYSEVFDGQHHAHWGPSGDLVLFDNAYPTPTPRGLVMDLDVATMTVTTINQGTMTDAGGSTFSCPAGGSTVQFSAGGMVATCPKRSNTTAEFNEFSPSDTAVWKMDLSCAAGYSPSSLAFRGYPNPW